MKAQELEKWGFRQGGNLPRRKNNVSARAEEQKIVKTTFPPRRKRQKRIKWAFRPGGNVAESHLAKFPRAESSFYSSSKTFLSWKSKNLKEVISKAWSTSSLPATCWRCVKRPKLRKLNPLLTPLEAAIAVFLSFGCVEYVCGSYGRGIFWGGVTEYSVCLMLILFLCYSLFFSLAV